MTANASISRIFAETSGPVGSDPIILLHGWGSSAALMRPIATMLADAYRVHNLDLPGHGQSPPPPEPYDVEAFARVVRDYMLENNISHATIVGHSNGGRVGLFMAAHPEMCRLIERLVLISPSGIRPKRSLKYHIKKNTATVLKAPFQPMPEPWRSRGLEWLRFTLPWKLLGSSDYRKLRGVMRDTFVLTVNSYLDDVVARIRVPTLIFRGDQDADISRMQVEKLRDAIPGAELVELENAGHYGYLDQPEALAEETRRFLLQSQ